MTETLFALSVVGTVIYLWVWFMKDPYHRKSR